MKKTTPWQKRLLEERLSLDKRIGKLKVFVGSERHASLSQQVKDLLYRQMTIMEDYLSVLDERIALFAKLCPPQFELAK